MSQRNRRIPFVVLALLLLLLWPAVAGVAAEQAADQDQPAPLGESAAVLAAGFGFSAAARQAIAAGEIVSRDWPSSRPGTLAAAVAMRLPMPLAEAERSVLRSGLSIAADPELIDVQALNATASGGSTAAGAEGALDATLGRLGFASEEAEEAIAFLRAMPGSRFNLSTTEFAVLARRVRREGIDAGASVGQATKAYRAVLAERFRRYRALGLEGIDGYDRGGEVVSPADALRGALDGFRANLPQAFAPLVAALDAYPQPLPAGMRERFFWKKARIENRPTIILLHVLTLRQDASVLFAVREFYVGHSYESLQQFGALVTDSEHSLLLLANSTATERVTGLFGGLARAIGTGRVREALETYFAALRHRAPEELARTQLQLQMHLPQ